MLAALPLTVVLICAMGVAVLLPYFKPRGAPPVAAGPMLLLQVQPQGSAHPPSWPSPLPLPLPMLLPVVALAPLAYP